MNHPSNRLGRGSISHMGQKPPTATIEAAHRDHLDNLPVELVKYRSLGLGDDQLAGVLGGTARALFDLVL